MNSRNKIAVAAWLLVAALASSSVVAQTSDTNSKTAPEASEVSAKQETEKSEEVNWSFDDLPKRPTSEREQQIIDKIVHVVTSQYDSVEHAFSKLDVDQNGNLDRTEVSGLLRAAKLSRLVRVIATGRLIDRYDVSDDDTIQWPEFNFAITKAMDKARTAENLSASNQR